MGALVRSHRSQLVLVDVQEKLCAVMPKAAMHDVVTCCGLLLEAARWLEVPVLYTEQYPKGLGATLPQLVPGLAQAGRVEKTCFSCWEHPGFRSRLATDRNQVVLAGMETHICILQTALDLHAQGREVFVVEDAVISRHPDHKANALARLRQEGIVVSTAESTVFEWLRVAEGEAFKAISKLIR